MMFPGVGDLRDRLAEYGEVAQDEPVVVMKHGKPWFVIRGVKGRSLEEVIAEISGKPRKN